MLTAPQLFAALTIRPDENRNEHMCHDDFDTLPFACDNESSSELNVLSDEVHAATQAGE